MTESPWKGEFKTSVNMDVYDIADLIVRDLTKSIAEHTKEANGPDMAKIVMVVLLRMTHSTVSAYSNDDPPMAADFMAIIFDKVMERVIREHDRSRASAANRSRKRGDRL